MSWLSSLFGSKKSAPPQQTSTSSDNSEALIREQMDTQKRYQMELDFRSSREAAEAAQPISEARREGFLGSNSLLSAGGMGGWSRNGISQGSRTNIQGSTYRMATESPTPQSAAASAGAMPHEVSQIIKERLLSYYDSPNWFKKISTDSGDWRAFS